MSIREMVSRQPTQNYEPFGLSFKDFRLPSDGEVDNRISTISTLTSPGVLLRLNVKEKVPKNLIAKSDVFPLGKITLVDTPPDSKVLENPSKKQTVRYSASNGGELVIYMGNLWRIAGDFVSRDWKIKNRRKWWFEWVTSNADKFMPALLNQVEINEGNRDKVVEEGVDGESEFTEQTNEQSPFIPFNDELSQETYVVWQRLIDDLIVKQAALTHLTTGEALYKKFILEHEIEHEAIRWLLVGSLGIFANISGLRIISAIETGIFFGDQVASFVVSRQIIENKLEKKRLELLHEIGDEPLIRII